MPLRVALTAASPCQLAGQAGDAARLLRTGGQADMTGSPEVRVSAGAAGSVVVLFPGCAESAAGQPALLAASLQALRTLDALGVRPTIGRAAECGGVPAVPIPAALPPGNTDQAGRPGAALTQALAALFTAGALTDLTPFLPTANAGEEGIGGGRETSGSTLASRTVPRMRAAEEADPSGPAPAGAVSCGGAGNPARSVT
jgi:hypothetical protein